MPSSPKNSISRISLRDIAAAAQVSVGSVSSVLNNRQVERRIPADTAAKIRAIASQLGYLPNINARRLRSSESLKNAVILALVTSYEAPITLINHFLHALQREINRPARPAYSVMVEMYSAGRLQDLPGLLTGDRFNAAVILNTIAEDDRFLSRTRLPYPVVVVNRAIPDLPCVIENPDGVGNRAAEVLISKRRTHLAVLHGTPLTQTTQTRVDRFLRRGIELLGSTSTEIISHSLSEEGGYAAMRQFLRSGRKCDGLYAVSDALALGAFRAIKEVGLKIPRQISVVGVGDYEIAPFLEPPLSCVGVSHRALAIEATKLLFAQLSGKPHDTVVTVPISENLRESSGH